MSYFSIIWDIPSQLFDIFPLNYLIYSFTIIWHSFSIKGQIRSQLLDRFFLIISSTFSECQHLLRHVQTIVPWKEVKKSLSAIVTLIYVMIIKKRNKIKCLNIKHIKNIRSFNTKRNICFSTLDLWQSLSVIFSPRFDYSIQCHTMDSKMVLDASLIKTKHYKTRVKGKWNFTGKWVASSLTPRCS